MPSGAYRTWLDTRGNERHAFVRLLIRNPSVLLKHAAPLLHAVVRRVRTRLAPLVASKHRRRKKRPPWLRRGGAPVLQLHGAAAVPRYPCAVRVRAHTESAAADPSRTSDDPEDYLADQRWGFLLDALMQESIDPSYCLQRCAFWVANHCDRSDPGWEPYSTCERVANLLVFLSVLQSAPEGVAVFPDMNRFLGESVDWIYRHLEYYGPFATNNHILNNARALVMAGAVCRDQATVTIGMQVFRASLPELIAASGFLRERSSHYQLVILNWALDAWWFVAAFSGQSGADARFLWSYIDRMLAASAMLCDRGKKLLATIGDVSPDASPPATLMRLNCLYPEFWPVPSQHLASCRIADGWFRIALGKELILGNFPGTGYPPVFPTHGHCDFPGFVWLRDGDEVLTDPGRYRYTQDAVSLFQSSAAGHNVPLVNGLAPLCESLTAGMWWPSPFANALLDVNLNGDSIVLEHDGFSRASPVKRHARRITPEPFGLITVDSFDGVGEIEVTFCWHFGEGFSNIDINTMTLTGSAGQLQLSFEGVAGPPETPTFEGLPGGWISRRYGEKVTALRLFLRWRVRLPSTVSTRFCLTAAPH